VLNLNKCLINDPKAVNFWFTNYTCVITNNLEKLERSANYFWRYNQHTRLGNCHDPQECLTIKEIWLQPYFHEF